MKRAFCGEIRMIAVLVLVMLRLVCFGQSSAVESKKDISTGSISGSTQTPFGHILSGTQVTAHNLEENTDRLVISDALGKFEITDLKPGHYQLTAHREDLATSSAKTVKVEAGETLHNDLTVAPAVAAAASPSPLQGSFLHRLFKAYADDWKGTTPSGPTPPFRGNPSPVDGPPFPFSDWPYGGSVVIGKPWTQSGPLMQAIWSGKHGEGWKQSGVQIYGWANIGFNVSTSNRPGYANLPAAYAERPNTIQPDQEVLYIERQPDTTQTDHFDWGFRVANLWGIDYRFTTAKGVFSQQLLTHNKEYGYDPVMVYADLYFPHVAQGMDVRIGRYISLPDIEAQLAPNNYTYTHSLTYTYDCYTQSGINTTTRLNTHWTIQLGFSAGCEAVPWTKHDAKPTYNFGFTYTWNDGYDSIYPIWNALNNGKYAYNNLQAMYLTWYHRFRSHPSIHTATEYWYMYEKQVPNVNNPAAASLLQTNANGAVCNSPQQLTCFAPEHAVVNYVEKEFSKKDYLTIRNEYFNDQRGQRTGFRTAYSEHLVGWGHWIGTTILFRPELRFERSYNVPAYDNGTKKNQFMFAGDVIYFF